LICEKCGRAEATEIHHKFSQTKRNKKIYGELIHNPINLQYLCYDCHHNKPVDKLTESEFRGLLLLREGKGISLPELKKPTGKCRREG